MSKKKTRISYAEKNRRKFGSGSRDPRWMWWAEVSPSEDNPTPAPRPVAQDAPRGPQYRGAKALLKALTD